VCAAIVAAFCSPLSAQELALSTPAPPAAAISAADAALVTDPALTSTEPRLRKRKAHGVGGFDLLRQLEHRRALEATSRSVSAASRAHQEQMLQAFLQDTDVLGREVSGYVSQDGPDHAALLSCWRVPVAKEHAPVKFEGVAWLAHRYLRRAARRTWKRHVVERRRFDPAFRHGDYMDAVAAYERFDANRIARMSSPFPTYWTGDAEEVAFSSQRVVVGERHEVVRFEGLSLRNDLRVRYRSEAPFIQPDQDAEEEELEKLERRQRKAAQRRRSRAAAHARGSFDAPNGNLLSSKGVSLDGRIRVRGSLSRPTLLRSMNGSLELRVHDSYDNLEVWSLELNVELEATGESRAALMWSLSRF
jgi:hypothetical protein